jgi:hypothetical protein
MRRLRARLAMATAFSLLVPAIVASTAAAVPPSRGCPTESGYFLVDQQGWWDESVIGFGIAGIQVYVDDNPANGFTADFDALAAGAGFSDGQGLYDFIWGPQWDHLNHNGDAYLCMKRRPITPGGGNPGFFFNGRDNATPA